MSDPPVLPATRGHSLAEALEALEAGAIVAVPTDTVYGLAARLDRPEAVGGVFTAKGRPPGLALPVLIGRWRQIDEVATEWPPMASALAARFWPGPLTVVVATTPERGQLLGGSGATVGLRQPRHRFLQRLCREAGPLAVTSANHHARPPCTTAGQVAEAFGPEEVALVLDGGTCDGTPSTVVDCTSTPPTCLRQGAISWEWIEAAAALQAARRRSRLFGARRR